MKIKVKIPLTLYKLTGGTTEFESHGDTVGELLTNLKNQFPDIKETLYDTDGKIRPYYSFFINGRLIKFYENESLPLNDGDEFFIMQIVAGG